MKILIVDDHANNRELLTFILEDEGHCCLEAQNGQLAVEAFEADRDIQLVLMDVNMPVMDGIAATREIKNRAADRFVTVIFVTAFDDSEVLVKCLDAGGDDFVPKPVNEDVLLSKLKAHARNQAMYNSLKSVNEELAYHKRLIDREHKIVEHIFANDIGLLDTACDNIQAYTSSASLFNGDLLLSAPSPAGGVYLLLGDFTGHGLSAAVGSLPVSSIFYDSAARQESISYMARMINRRLQKLLPHGMFFCAALIYLDPQGRQVQIWLGGMNDVLCVHPKNQEITKITAMHMPLGIMEDDEFDERIQLLELPVGTKLYAFTDGVNEAKNANNEEFGLKRIEQVVANEQNAIASLVAQVRAFTEGCEQLDDVSVVELTCAPVLHRHRHTQAVVDVSAGFRHANSFEWSLDISLQDDDLRSNDIVMQVGKFLGTIQGVELHQDKIFTIISELYSNALEHGVLRLDSALKETPDGFDDYYRQRTERLAAVHGQAIHIRMAYLRAESSNEPNRLKIEVTDSGEGFDSCQLKVQQEANEMSFGRGITLLDSFCESLTYSNGGRTATAFYAFS